MRDRAVLVTGGAGHIAKTAAETFAELGAAVALLDVDSQRCKATCDAIALRFGGTVIPIICDLEDSPGIAPTVDGVIGSLGQLDVLVNCAAFVGSANLPGWKHEFREQTAQTFSRVLQVNLTAPFLLAQAAADSLSQARGGGSIINISSIYGSVGPDMSLYEGLEMGNPAAYAASKAGLEQLTRWLATVLAPKVRVNAIAPGGIIRDQPEAFRERYSARTPLGRLATEDDLRGAFAYFGSALSLYVTGQTLAVDGGWLAW